MGPIETGWHREVLPQDALETLKLLSGNPAAGGFYLAGGTALALQWGHRTSIDLDFFNSDSFSEDALISNLRAISGIQIISKASETLHLHIGNTKVSFLGYHYPMLFPCRAFEGAMIASPQDIAAMKLNAVASRGTKRDFVDLYVLSLRYGLGELVNFFEQKFAGVEYNIIHILKSLTYFTDAETEPLPHLLQPLNWDEIKRFFANEAPRLRYR